jgi:hypothetical protein
LQKFQAQFFVSPYLPFFGRKTSFNLDKWLVSCVSMYQEKNMKEIGSIQHRLIVVLPSKVPRTPHKRQSLKLHERANVAALWWVIKTITKLQIIEYFKLKPSRMNCIVQAMVMVEYEVKISISWRKKIFWGK